MRTNRIPVMCAAATAALLAVPATQAATINPGLYQLHNHPDGNAAAPYYGLRLDELINVTSGHDVFTFNFDAVGAAMFLEYDGSSIHIFGRAFGGLDTGSNYHPLLSGYVDIDFTYSTVTQVAGDDDLHVTTPNGTNTGHISVAGHPLLSQALSDYAGNFGYTFRFGDENDDQGHRGFNGLSGWGWLNHGNHHVASSDWLFTATVVPLPPAALLGALGLIPVIAAKKLRRKRSAK